MTSRQHPDDTPENSDDTADDTSDPSRTSASTPTAQADRVPAPDIARGLLLLGIALANVPYWLTSSDRGLLFKPLGDGIDSTANAIVAMVADGRSFPLFALLYGYGMTQILLRERARDVPWPAARGLLVRRNLWIIVFGAVHALLLFAGDIMGTYGLLGLLLVLLIRASGRVLAIVGGVAFGFLVVASSAQGLAGILTQLTGPLDSGVMASPGATTYLQSMGLRALEWGATLLAVPFVSLGFLAPMTLGIWAARYRVLENPQPHRRALAVVAGAGIPISLVGALPVALVLVGALGSTIWLDPLLAMLHGGTGAVGAVGYLALIALVAARRTPGWLGRRLAALGRISLTGYLLQSLVFLLVFPSFTLGLGTTTGAATATLIAVGTWMLSLAVAATLEWLHRSGPAEWMLRRLLYRGTRRPKTQVEVGSGA